MRMKEWERERMIWIQLNNSPNTSIYIGHYTNWYEELCK